jgi:hypothetical protein
MDEIDELFIVDRKKHIINIVGFKVFPPKSSVSQALVMVAAGGQAKVQSASTYVASYTSSLICALRLDRPASVANWSGIARTVQ